MAAGNATISAQMFEVVGSVGIRVIAAQLDEIPMSLSDPFAAALVAAQTGAIRDRVQAALTQCLDGVTEGNFDTIENCLSDARTEIQGATDPTDRVLLFSLTLFLDHIERLLNP